MIPVLDLMNGQAVRARGGARAAYRPLESVLAPGAGDAAALARALRQDLGCVELYVADLDAIAGAAPQAALWSGFARTSSLLVDAGIATIRRAQETIDAGAVRVVVGLETLPSFELLDAVVRAVGSDHVVFSLDLRDGRPITKAGAGLDAPPLALVQDAVAAGVGALLVLDLARVGTGAGLDLELLASVRAAHPAVELFAGGGVGGAGDLARIAATGCDAVLIASALHEGRLGARELSRHANDSR